jgi:hypothetical protein
MGKPVIHILRAKWLGDGTLAAVTVGGSTSSERHALWYIVTVRKAHKCFECEETFGKGHKMFAPLGNWDYRMRRCCIECMALHVVSYTESLSRQVSQPTCE